ncbi:MAG: glycoside hydrolase family 99-like domain-containing protein [Verrucomicrobia bacterium]|nr:glycoside hydrolase family 99-like domain-containing protein [Verrucomicrobiota bacterium]MBU1735519.1 glycoside hydrolase family 99-like domain-containing protein [Verrucomicrobiota bacterium]MBU1855441.1 glycoside hydrolase family 99-like domain-containing protein [Verrucomicrobiota bacterium]
MQEKSLQWDFRSGLNGWVTAYGLSPLRVTKRGLLMTSKLAQSGLFAPSELDIEAGPGTRYALVSMAVDKDTEAEILFAIRGNADITRCCFPVRGDGKIHTYSVDLGCEPKWCGKVAHLGLRLATEAGLNIMLRSLAFSAEPLRRPEVEIQFFGSSDTLNRVGTPAQVECVLFNYGGVDATLQVGIETGFPEWLRPVDSLAKDIELPPGLPVVLRWQFIAERQGEATLTLEVEGKGVKKLTGQTSLLFQSLPNLSKVSYVPKPEPVATEYQVGAYYYPNWIDHSRWAPMQTWPGHKPALGWYDGTNPEVADWYIKWMLEHGITFIAFDWYWGQDGGAFRLGEELERGFLKARYSSLMKFCVNWCNHSPHNPQGTYSKKDLLAMTQYWIDHYFTLPNYLRTDEKPVLFIYQPDALADELGSATMQNIFARMDELCQQRDIPGIWKIACVHGYFDGDMLKNLGRQGYNAISSYSYHGAYIGENHVLDYGNLLEVYWREWNRFCAEVNPLSLKFIPPLSAGWDPRPRLGPAPISKRFCGYTPHQFKTHCALAKRLLDMRRDDCCSPGMCLIEAWNEWTEGSYFEPHAEHGFSFLDGLREVFAKDDHPHIDITPRDVGLGDYDVKLLEPRTAWHFDKNGDMQGWYYWSQIANLRVEGSCLKGKSVGLYPSLLSPPLAVDARRFKKIVLRMRCDTNDTAYLAWSTFTSPEVFIVMLSNKHRDGNYAARFENPGDGEFHEYVLPVGENPQWCGFIRQLLIIPATKPGLSFEIDWMRME